MHKATVSIAMFILCVAFSSGCAAWTDKSKKKDSLWSSMQFWKKPYQKPNKLAAIWTHDILAMTGKPPTRGFGGRLYFYNEKSQAIPVDGELYVHGYEEARIGLAVQTEKTKADKTFMFTPEQFTEHFSSSDLGASYSIWIPWDAADGDQKEITLIPTFKGKDGTVLQGEPAKLLLPGRKQEDPFAEAAIQHVSFQQSQTPTNMGPLPQLNASQTSGLRTTTIAMPAHKNRVGREKSNTSNFANERSVVIHDSLNGSQINAANSNMSYAGSPQSAQANAMFAAFQAGANGINQQASIHGQTSNGQFPMGNPPYPSTMPNMLSSQLPPSHAPAIALPQNQYLLHNSGAQTQLNHGMQNTGMQNAGMQNAGMPNTVTPVPGNPYPSMPNMQSPNNQIPAAPKQLSPQEKLMQEINPGFAASHSPLKPGAVEAAFASTPQFQPFGQVQPAGYNSMQPTISAQVPGQAQGLPGQPMFQR